MIQHGIVQVQKYLGLEAAHTKSRRVDYLSKSQSGGKCEFTIIVKINGNP
jgi:hypothetical protein